VLCLLGLVLLAVALFLPCEGVLGIRGYFALLLGWIWYPSNAALVLAPFICAARNADLKVVWTFALAGTFFANIMIGPPGVIVGYWVWTAAFAVSALGMSVSALALELPAELNLARQPLPAGLATVVLALVTVGCLILVAAVLYQADAPFLFRLGSLTGAALLSPPGASCSGGCPATTINGGPSPRADGVRTRPDCGLSGRPSGRNCRAIVRRPAAGVQCP
jgi:hypothetical protein